MKINLKYITLVLIAFITMNSCERDDICIDEITPHLIVRFYDNDDLTKTKTVNQLSVKIIGIENDSIIFSSTDSIAIPLKVTDDITQYILTVDSNDGTILNRDTLIVNYEREDVLVGRSCGFKTIFNNTNYVITSDSDNWIKNSETVTQLIETETAAHVKIFH